MDNFFKIVRENTKELQPIPTPVAPRLTKLSGIKAAIFDMYGTLFISGSGDIGTATLINKSIALTETLESMGIEGDLDKAGELGIDLLTDEIKKWHNASKQVGIDFPEIEIRKVWKSIIDQLTNNKVIIADYSNHDLISRLSIEYECRVNPVYPMPSALRTITALRDMNIKLGIVSNAQFFTPLLFKTFFEKDYDQYGFDKNLCIWSYEEQVAKPSRSLFKKLGEKIFEQYAINLSEVVYIGNDMLNDIYCAQQVGCKTVLFAGDKRSLRLRKDDDRCKNITPDAIITSLSQILEIL